MNQSELLKAKTRFTPLPQDETFDYRVSDVDPDKYNPHNCNSKCGVCPAKEMCAMHYQDGHCHRLIQITSAVIAHGKPFAKRYKGVGDTAFDRAPKSFITANTLAQILPCALSERFPVNPEVSDYIILAIRQPNPIFKDIKHPSDYTDYWWNQD